VEQFDNLMEKGNSICICVPQRSGFYLQADYKNFTDIWINTLIKVLEKRLIAEQFLTLENVPMSEVKIFIKFHPKLTSIKGILI
jgi:hypothetical protein